jgi:hypothetical protein
MGSIIGFLTKNWVAVSAALAVAAVAAFFQVQLWIADAKHKDVVSQRDAAIAATSMWEASHNKLQFALRGVEADKKILQDKLAQASESARIAAKAAARNASETARVTALLRSIEETSNDPENTDRIRSLSIDFLRERQSEERPS